MYGSLALIAGGLLVVGAVLGVQAAVRADEEVLWVAIIANLVSSLFDG